MSMAIASACMTVAPVQAQCTPGWVAGFGGTGLNGTVRTAANWDPDGPGPEPTVLVVGGEFTQAGGQPATRLAKWDGLAWTTLGLDRGTIVALWPYPSGELLAGAALTPEYGSFTAVQRWDGSSWERVGYIEFVQALAVLPDGTILAGGGWSSNEYSAVARWNGQNWRRFGLNSGSVRSMVLQSNGDLIVGGQIRPPDATASCRVGRWNGTEWSCVGTGPNWVVNCVAVTPDGRIFAGGEFTIADGNPALNIAGWDGTSWSGLGSGLNGTVNALVVMPNGDLIAGGSFSIAGGVAVNFLARWDGSSWSPVGSGLNGVVRTLLVLPDGDLLVGGQFTQAGGVSAGRIARYTFGNPPVITAQPQSVQGCLSTPATISLTPVGNAPLSFVWRKDGQPIDPVENPSAATATLALAGVHPSDVGSYDCVVTNSCGSVTSSPVVVTLCAADFNCDGSVNSDDLADFATGYFNDPSDPRTDHSGDGPITMDDLCDFITAYFNGC